MSGSRQVSRPPLLARLSQRRFRRWAEREVGAASFAALGEGSLVCPPAMIRGHDRIRIGSDVVVHPGAIISVVTEHDGARYDPELSIGNGVRIGCDFVIACCGRITIEDDVLAADRVFIGDTYHAYRDPTRPILHQGLSDPRPVRIGAGAFLGVNSAVLPGVSVGDGAYLGANAVVTEDVPPRSLVVGNPARVVRRWHDGEWVDEPIST